MDVAKGITLVLIHMYFDHLGDTVIIPRNPIDSDEEIIHRCSSIDPRDHYISYGCTYGVDGIPDKVYLDHILSVGMKKPEYRKYLLEHIRTYITDNDTERILYYFGRGRSDTDIISIVPTIYGIATSRNTLDMATIMSDVPHIHTTTTLLVTMANHTVVPSTYYSCIILDRVSHLHDNPVEYILSYVQYLLPGGLLIINEYDYYMDHMNYVLGYDISSMALYGITGTSIGYNVYPYIQLQSMIKDSNLRYIKTYTTNTYYTPYTMVYRKVGGDLVITRDTNITKVLGTLLPMSNQLINDVHYTGVLLQSMISMTIATKIANWIANTATKTIGSRYTVFDLAGYTGIYSGGVLNDQYTLRTLRAYNLYENSGYTYLASLLNLYLTPTDSPSVYAHSSGHKVYLRKDKLTTTTMEYMESTLSYNFGSSLTYIRIVPGEEETTITYAKSLLHKGMGMVVLQFDTTDIDIPNTSVYVVDHIKCIAITYADIADVGEVTISNDLVNEVLRNHILSDVIGTIDNNVQLRNLLIGAYPSPDIGTSLSMYIIACRRYSPSIDPVLACTDIPIQVSTASNPFEKDTTLMAVRKRWDGMKALHPAVLADVTKRGLVGSNGLPTKPTLDEFIAVVGKAISTTISMEPINVLMKKAYDKYISIDTVNLICNVVYTSNVITLRPNQQLVGILGPNAPVLKSKWTITNLDNIRTICTDIHNTKLLPIVSAMYMRYDTMRIQYSHTRPVSLLTKYRFTGEIVQTITHSMVKGTSASYNYDIECNRIPMDSTIPTGTYYVFIPRVDLLIYTIDTIQTLGPDGYTFIFAIPIDDIYKDVRRRLKIVSVIDGYDIYTL